MADWNKCKYSVLLTPLMVENLLTAAALLAKKFSRPAKKGCSFFFWVVQSSFQGNMFKTSWKQHHTCIYHSEFVAERCTSYLASQWCTSTSDEVWRKQFDSCYQVPIMATGGEISDCSETVELTSLASTSDFALPSLFNHLRAPSCSKHMRRQQVWLSTMEISWAK